MFLLKKSTDWHHWHFTKYWRMCTKWCKEYFKVSFWSACFCLLSTFLQGRSFIFIKCRWIKSKSKFAWILHCCWTSKFYNISYSNNSKNCWHKFITFVFFLCSVDHASLYNLVNETNLVHNLFSVYFVNFTYNLYMFRTSPSPSSGGTTVFIGWRNPTRCSSIQIFIYC